MAMEVFKHMKGKVFYPLCGTDVVWGECTNNGCDYIVFGDSYREDLKKVKTHMRENGMNGDCVRLEFDHLPFRKGSFQTVIYKPGPNLVNRINIDIPFLKEIIEPEVLLAVNTDGCMHFSYPPITRNFVEDFSKKNGYALKEVIEPEMEVDNAPLGSFIPKLVLVFEREKS
jgi:hypothetical protein